MPISSQLRVLLARANLERAKQGQRPLSLRRLATESGVSLSVVAALSTGQSQRIDYATIDRLLNFFNAYGRVTTDDLLAWEPNQPGRSARVRNREAADAEPSRSVARGRQAHRTQAEAEEGR